MRAMPVLVPLIGSMFRKVTTFAERMPLVSPPCRVNPYRKVLTRFDFNTDVTPAAIPLLLESVVVFGGWPGNCGVNSAALAVLKQYPVGNNSSLGDGLNFTGYTFNAPIHSKQDTYTAKLDYKLDSSGKESLFWRGN